MGRNLSTLFISSSYQFLTQLSGSELQTGLGTTITGSLLITSSKADTATTASYALTATSASYALNATTAVTASFATNFTASNILITGLATVASASITNLLVVYETSSVIYSSGSNQFGDATDDVQLLIGTVKVTGSLQVTGSTISTLGFTGSLQGTASVATSAVSASYALNATSASYTPNAVTTASVSSNIITFTKDDGSTFPVTVNTGSGAAAFPFTGSAQITGSLIVTGSVTIRTGSLVVGDGGQTNTSAIPNNGNIVLGGAGGTNQITNGYGALLAGGYNGYITPTTSNFGHTVIGGSGLGITTNAGANNTIVGGYYTTITAGEMGSGFGARDSVISAT